MSKYSAENPPPMEVVLSRVDDLLRGLMESITRMLERLGQSLPEAQRRHVGETLINLGRQLNRELMPSPKIIHAATQSLVSGESPVQLSN